MYEEKWRYGGVWCNEMVDCLRWAQRNSVYDPVNIETMSPFEFKMYMDSKLCVNTDIKIGPDGCAEVWMSIITKWNTDDPLEGMLWLHGVFNENL